MIVAVTNLIAKMTIYQRKPLKLDKVSTYPLASRASKVTVQDFARVPRQGTGVRAWLDSVPHILAAESLRAVVAAIERARSQGQADHLGNWRARGEVRPRTHSD